MASTTNENPLRIAIIGGGIAGVTLLLALLKHSSREIIAPHLYEATPEFSEIGAGIAFGSNSIRAMELIDRDMAAAYNKHATFQPDTGALEKKLWSSYRMGMDGRGSNTLKAGDYIHEVHASVARSSVHRARFLEAMTALLPTGYVSFGKRLTSIDDVEDGVTVHFADGTSVTADAVIGCDGIKSRVRQILLDGEEEANAVFTGKYAYRGLIPMDEAVGALGEYTARNNHFHWGYDGHLLTFPIEHGKTMNVVAFRTKPNGVWEHGSQWVLPGNKEQMLQDFEAWGPDVKAILSLMRNADIWAMFDHPPAKSYHRGGRICIMGDAAHASTPHQGAGAGMAVEDVYILSRLLGKVREKGQLERAFAAYDAVRRPRTQRLVRTSRDAGRLYQCQKEEVEDDVEKIRANLDERMRWIWDLDMEQHLEEALSVFAN
ncbi:FAD/NAD(P)-binding domain-containing protein [Aspergillus sclerotioniger CBS 115572]|uniref:FAD/NAD(P)-binding domain-containing protein n=1 Tax=Aspergillus sclerotioniger CBS 115572 TaxID=1450535 RepID=A0A317WPY4_9EURO|nr:FAD/NAD(P)-binding domain-containing protein [Aspergillus sclerotioniger CBS 115572]PWY88105.1 FAD/NAD(P)-binding domain-containing protein [Aspergillus sclerotioniger CBS 115572]